MVLRTVRAEFRVRNLYYEHHDSTIFHTSQWKWHPLVYPILRVLLALYIVAAFIAQLVNYYTTAVDHSLLKKNATHVILNDTTGYPVAITTTTDFPVAIATTTVFSIPVKESTKGSSTDVLEGWDTRRPWWAFLTLWSYTVLFLHTVLAAILSVIFYGKTKPNNDGVYGKYNMGYIESEGDNSHKSNRHEAESGQQYKTSDPKPLAWYFKLSWILSDIISPIAPVVSVIFFAALWKGGPLDPHNANIHLFNSIMVLIDHMISSRPVKLLHFVAPMMFGLAYNVFNVIFWSFDHKEHVLYPGVLDWNYPGKTALVVIIVLIVMVPLFILLSFLFYRLKLRLHQAIYGKDE